SDDDAQSPEQALDADAVDLDWRSRAADVIPGGTSTGSKRAAALYGPESTGGPTHFVSASGCRVVTASGRTLIDCTMALGAVAIGYGDDVVTRAIVNAVANGHVSGLASTLEVEIAERLCDVIPCAEQVRFLKSGADAMSAAVRIARAATERSRIVGSGYFGRHDWWNNGSGIPAGAHADFTAVDFDDLPALERAARNAGRSLAAIVIEPVQERLPSKEWMEGARRLCDELGAVLIFDEMKTGFRLAPGGYQEYAGVTPDLAAFGKAMANGFPVAAIVGRAAIMEALENTWISSTLAGESLSLAAVSAVLDIYEEVTVCDTLWRVGAELRQRVGEAVAASNAPGVELKGIDPMWSLSFADESFQTRFLERAASLGVLFKRGAYNFASVAHDEEETILSIENIASTALVELMEEDAR
ncbi:MAG: aminotransferase class III-fold pyridoxal phosphate-dependent enzyme, partial [Gemmatimonadaceae bacterium]